MPGGSVNRNATGGFAVAIFVTLTRERFDTMTRKETEALDRKLAFWSATKDQHAIDRRNAELVPELLAALENAANVLAGIATGDLKTIGKDSPALAQCRAAISKAKGGA